MINKLSFLGLIGLLGLLAVPTGEVRYCAFFAFFVFFGYLFTVEDELFTAYVRKAATTAFFLQTVLFCIVYAVAVLIGDAAVFTTAFPLTFAAGMFVFICMLVIHEFRELQGVESGA
ncbi:DUF3796 domain-containing protein [Methanocorpusculum vombati]|uniref:DUF3796 domain-containing protein n=1 Tax=Methanocorpusculum vombati TaxID=3002864 RepID=A0ABT4INJ1_9EURY|nr:DUF3796 domain-containing protein [Methanocorpusculum vombati]MCZ9318970.1 DUF3796 domain-containing protein [Methanocorpusculum sp.]MCZ0863321.1 DUF3796 domain-containing protein [Methanocorpusculum vombati]MDE2520808.1 DUF3796 domain-containing protein [Methanocorpusculum sp.]MDE2533803.1 DUF3796 domain-containing protein [Methanocorpusculum sp.]MDE2545298.1 DUF3796 domain-containing protein [Methanocorpusculum sp.]